MAIEQTRPPGGELSGLPAGEWEVDAARSELGFAVKVMGFITVRGVFEDFAGGLDMTGPDPIGGLTIQAASLNTHNNRRDQHLRSADFFDAGRYPAVRFLMAAVAPSEAGVTIAGELEIGASRTSLEIPATAAQLDDGSLRIAGTVTVSRSAAGLTWNWLGTVGDDAALHATLTLTRRHSRRAA